MLDYNNDLMDRAARDFTVVQVDRRRTTETVVDNPGSAGRIVSGRDMTIDIGSGRNLNSQVIAGGRLTVTGGTLDNEASQGRRTVVDSGTWRKDHVAYVNNRLQEGRYGTGTYLETIEDRTVALSTGRIEQYAAQQPSRFQPPSASATVGEQLPKPGLIDLAPTPVDTPVRPTAPTVPTPDRPAEPLPGETEVRTAVPDLRLPSASLYRTDPGGGGRFLVETDPRFTSYRQWLSSDYLLAALGIDPDRTQKRLGDGFYEQQLIRQQIGQLTGRRYLDGYSDDGAQYTALLDAGATFARSVSLRPGIALSADQVARLTSDIVWLVTRTVTLPDGSSQQVLVPQLYVHVRPGDLDGDGALLAGRNVDIRLSGDLRNAGGTIAGREVVTIDAGNVANLSGRISANRLGIHSREDIDNIGGTLDAGKTLLLDAGRDLNIRSTTLTNDLQAGESAFGRTGIDRVAGVYLTGEARGVLVASAGRDVDLTAGVIANASQGGSTVVDAGRDLRLDTLQTASSHTLADGRNHSSDSRTDAVGSRIQAGGDIALNAGQDIAIRGGDIDAGQALQLTAGRDVRIENAESTSHLDQSHTSSSSSFLSSARDTRTDRVDTTSASASNLGGKTVAIGAGRDIAVQGSNVVSDERTVLLAQRDIAITAATDTRDEEHTHDTKKSGLSGTGGLGITAGVQQTLTRMHATSTTAAASTVGSIGGDVTIGAGNRYTQVGSDVVAPSGDITIAARDVAITEARETTQTHSEQHMRQSGVTLAVTSPVISAVQTALQTAHATANTDSGRMRALGVVTTAASAATAVKGIGAMGAANGPGEAAAAGNVGISLTAGSSRSDSSTDQVSDRAAGSRIQGRNVTIVAQGGGVDSNILIRGSDVSANQDTVLNAENRVDILAAQNTAAQRSRSSSSSTSVGVAATAGPNGTTVGVTVSASAARGREDGEDVTYTTSHVSGGNRVSIKSGGDTNIVGGVIAGKRVELDVGGNLRVESLQDRSTYTSRNESIGGSLTVGAGVSGSVNASRTQAQSDYANVQEQSGIQAGDGGFGVKVKGNTDLAGGVIASSQAAIDARLNSLQTATLTSRDLENQSNASASSQGVALDSGMANHGKYGSAKAGLNLLNNAKDSESVRGETKSAVSEGGISITDDAGQVGLTGKNAVATVASIDRDTKNSNVGVQRIDIVKMQNQVRADQQIKGATIVHATKFTDEAYRKMFVDKAEMYVLEKNADGTPKIRADGKPSFRELNEQEKLDLKPSPDNKIHIANNGIFNDSDSAGIYAVQHSSSGSGEQYFIHFPEADNIVSEALIAGYQKYLEGGTLGLTNSTLEVIRAMDAYGQTGLVLDGHSRGSLTVQNALEYIAAQTDAAGKASGTTVNFFGPAANAADTDKTLQMLQNRGSMSAQERRDAILMLQNHVSDPVGALIGGNPSTGGTNPEGSNTILEMIRAATGQPTTSHNCYGSGGDECSGFWKDSVNGLPMARPINKIRKAN